MNKANIAKAIEVFNNIEMNEKVDMAEWIGDDFGDAMYRRILERPDQEHPCNSTACFAGHMALSGAFAKYELPDDPDGLPEWIADVFDITSGFARALCGLGDRQYTMIHQVNGVMLSYNSRNDVLRVLDYLMRLDEEPMPLP